MKKVLTTLATLIGVLEFLYNHLYLSLYPNGKIVLPTFGNETKIFSFIVIQILFFYFAVPISNSLIPKIKDYPILLLVFLLNMSVVGYASSINFKFFWGKFDPLIPVLKRNGNMNHSFYLIMILTFTCLITQDISKRYGWQWKSNDR